jgi:hypothetical protein
MRPQITHPRSMKRVLNYNEHKVQQKKAELIHAGNFLQLPEEMTFREKLGRFEKQMKLNQRAKTKVIHISLNFHPDDAKKLSPELLKQIADEYMQKIGFGDQPYLVYRHDDAGHPHIHIVSTMIRKDGSRINTHNLGKDLSNRVRKELEKKYDLTKADRKERGKQSEQSLKIDPRKVEAGKSETKQSIANVLDHVIDHYKYTSLEELNAILKQYNVLADRGEEDGRIYKNHGLTYTVIDENGKKITKPVKASAFHNKPTLDYIESKFKANELARESGKRHLNAAIDWAMQKNPRTWQELIKALEQEGIAVVLRQNENGQIYGVTYVDHVEMTVFNGSDLGKEYAAKRMLERLSGKEPQKPKEMTISKQKETATQKEPLEIRIDSEASVERRTPITGPSKIVERIMGPENEHSGANNELTEEQKRKRRKKLEREQ